MSGNLSIDASLSKEEKYIALCAQMKELIFNEDHVISSLSNFIAAIKQTFDFHWVGFYLVYNDQLILGPFQGPVACTTIGYGSGVCGKSWMNKEAIIVNDVNSFPGHIACSSFSQSEIVIPVFDENKEVIMVLDIDSDVLSDFDSTDSKYLPILLDMLKLDFNISNSITSK